MGSLMFAHEWFDTFGAGLIFKREVCSQRVGVSDRLPTHEKVASR